MEDTPTTTRVIVGPSAPGASDVYAYQGVGRPPAHDGEMVENVLWEVALCGGNCSRALNNIKEIREQADNPDELPALPRVETVRRWVRTQYRNRYHEICTTRARELEDRVAAQHTERAIAADEIKQQALRRIAAGLDNLDAVEASTVLRNVAGAQKQDVDSALGIRRQGKMSEDSRELIAIGQNLVRMGVAAIRGEEAPVDGEVVEEGGESLPPALPTGD